MNSKRRDSPNNTRREHFSKLLQYPAQCIVRGFFSRQRHVPPPGSVANALHSRWTLIDTPPLPQAEGFLPPLRQTRFVSKMGLKTDCKSPRFNPVGTREDAENSLSSLTDNIDALLVLSAHTAYIVLPGAKPQPTRDTSRSLS